MRLNPEISGVRQSYVFARADNMRTSGALMDEEPDSLGIVTLIDQEAHRPVRGLSTWSASARKRLFDIFCVVSALPLAVPAFLLAGLAVRLTSRGPVLFRQQRMGMHGRTFTIYKFRTMPVRPATTARPNVTTSINQRFTPVGPFLRRWKLDELPQLLNILRGDMSLVGPRPKMPCHQATDLNCRPGITGRATIVFAREEAALAGIPLSQLDAYYHGVVLPLKQILDEEYMSKATFASDFQLIVKSVLRRWEELRLSDLPMSAQFTNQERTVTPIKPRSVHQVSPRHTEVATQLQAD